MVDKIGPQKKIQNLLYEILNCKNVEFTLYENEKDY